MYSVIVGAKCST